ncbi:MAG: iron-sulfur cluster assembly scaffold protein [Spirochaetes bacterium]|nr:iron-sulfur cluster assembly scaffold protein [Spirochaetota bacterium]
MNEYSDKVYEHFKKPRNAGTIEEADGIGEAGDSNCGDFLRVYIKIDSDNIADVKYLIHGCPASIACASVMTELAIGQNIEDAVMISDEDIINALDGLPDHKQHCSNLGATGLKNAIMNYWDKNKNL